MARDQVFISYSLKDQDWLERLQIILTPLQRQGILKIWTDTDIPSGQLWKEEIKQALAKAKIAVLLVSPDFLASDFIDKYELPLLLEAAKDEGLTIFWIPVRPILHRETVLSKYQAVLDPQTPLSTLPVWQQEAALAKIARTIESIMRPTESGLLKRHIAPRTVLILTPRTEQSYELNKILLKGVMDRSNSKPIRFIGLSDTIKDGVSDTIERVDAIIVDLTGGEANVMYELGFAHALKKAVLPIIAIGKTNIPEVLQGYLFYVYDLNTLESQELLVKTVTEWLERIFREMPL